MHDLVKIFGTNIKAMEILSLIHGLKRVVRQGFYDQEIEQVKKYCTDHNLFLVRSEFKVILEDIEKDFSNKGIYVDKDDPREGMYFYYISKDELLAYSAAMYEINSDDYNLGVILGYPKCCIDFFLKHKEVQQGLSYNYEKPILENSNGVEFPFYTNIFQRHKDICLISHFPCSLNCSESIELAKANFNLLEKDISEEVRKGLFGEVLLHDKKIIFR